MDSGIVVAGSDRLENPILIGVVPADDPRRTALQAFWDEGLKVYMIPREPVELDPLQPRKTVTEQDLIAVAKTLGSSGMKQPIRIRFTEEVGRFKIVGGARRRLGVDRIKPDALHQFEFLPCSLVDRVVTLKDLLEDQLVENEHARRIPICQMLAAVRDIQRMDDEPLEQICDRLGFEPAHIRKHTPLIYLPGNVQEQLDNGRITQTAGLVLANETNDPAIQQEFAAKWVSKEIKSSDRLAEEIRNAIARKQRPIMSSTSPPRRDPYVPARSTGGSSRPNRPSGGQSGARPGGNFGGGGSRPSTPIPPARPSPPVADTTRPLVAQTRPKPVGQDGTGTWQQWEIDGTIVTLSDPNRMLGAFDLVGRLKAIILKLEE